MNSFSKYIGLFVALALYFLLWWMLGPFLGYNLDSDCVAYLTLAERVAAGDYFKSINGLWSPLNIWLCAALIRSGQEAWWSAKLLNFIFGAIILIQSHFLLGKFNTQKMVRHLLMPALGVAMVYFVYFQMFGDVLQMIFVMSYLLLLWRKPLQTPSFGVAVLSGIIMALGYYAKAYTFFFFVIHFFAILVLYYRQQKITRFHALKVYAVGILSAVIVILPWSFALEKKYHEWSLNGHAGKLNMSWYINSGKSFRPDIALLIPPTYDDSPTFWEDPYLSQSALSTPLSSAHHFVKWIFRVVHTTIVCVFCFGEISFVGLALLLWAIVYFFYRRSQAGQTEEDLLGVMLVLTISILPLGYLMMHIETRYIWLNTILLMCLGAWCLSKFSDVFSRRIWLPVSLFIFAVSFTLFPVYQFENLKDKNKDLFETAAWLNQQQIKGKFTAHAPDAGRMWVIAWLTKGNFYTIERSDYTEAELLQEMKRYDVRYYFVENQTHAGVSSLPGMQKIAGNDRLSVFEVIK